MPVLSRSINKCSVEEFFLAYIAKLPLILGYSHYFSLNKAAPLPSSELSQAEYILAILLGKIPEKDVVRIFEQSMILQAEHDLNASALTARICISAETDISSALTAAMIAFSGALHGGALYEVMSMLEEIKQIENVKPYIQNRIAKRLPIYGFGHRIYRAEDPRAKHLKEGAIYLSHKFNNMKWLEILEGIKDEMIDYREHGMHANVDFYASVSYLLMGIPKEFFVPIFAINRIPGWGAHIIEQQKNNILIRPRLKYKGPTGKKIRKKESGHLNV